MKNKIKSMIIPLFIFIISIGLANAITYNNVDPANGDYILLQSGNFSYHFNVTLQGITYGDYANITNTSIYIDRGNASGIFFSNITYINNAGTTTNYYFTDNSNFTEKLFPDGTTLRWFIRTWSYNESDVLYRDQNSSIYTLYFEKPPTTEINTSSGTSSSSAGNWINWTTHSVAPSTSQYTCDVYANNTANASGIMTRYPSSFNTVNITMYSYYYTFVDQKSILIGVKCWESSNENIFRWSESNITLLVDTVIPTLTINAPTAAEWKNSGTVVVNYTINDTNPDSVVLYVTTSSNVNYSKNTTNRTTSSGNYLTAFINLLNGGNYSIYLWGNDTVGHTVNSSVVNFLVDTTYPSFVSYKNESVETYALNWSFVVEASEYVNLTLNYAPNTSLGRFVFKTGYNTSHRSYIPFAKTETETLFSINMTVCDRAKNCNTSYNNLTTPLSYYTPAPVYTGWTQYVNLETNNLDYISNRSGADYVYVWNSTHQTWNYHTSGAKTNQYNWVPPYGSIIHLYESSNSTWLRDRTNITAYTQDFKSGHNWIGIVYNYNFFNLTRKISTLNQSTEFLGAYNNTRQGYENHIYNWTWGNLTDLKLKKVESVWLYSEVNITVYLNQSGSFIS